MCGGGPLLLLLFPLAVSGRRLALSKRLKSGSDPAADSDPQETNFVAILQSKLLQKQRACIEMRQKWCNESYDARIQKVALFYNSEDVANHSTHFVASFVIPLFSAV